jgi:hypothetical protein
MNTKKNTCTTHPSSSYRYASSRALTPHFLLCLLASASSCIPDATAFAAQSNNTAAVQTHFGDVSFAGGMAYEPVQDLLYVTGQLGQNACWTGILKLPQLQFLSKVVLPEPAVCQHITLLDQNPQHALLLATTEEGGLFTNTRVKGSNKATQYGLVVPLQYASDAKPSSVALPKGLLLHEDPVQTPRAVVSDPLQSQYLYVASLHSESNQLTQQFKTNAQGYTPNLTPGGMDKYGAQFFLQVERLEYNALMMTTTTTTNENGVLQASSWRKPFGLTPTMDAAVESHSVELGSMIWNQGALVLVGSTRGQGLLFGSTAQAISSNVTTATATATNEEQYCKNGFLSKLDPTTGRIWTSSTAIRRYRQEDEDNDDIDGSFDTTIEAVCSSGPDATDLYIVGFRKSLAAAAVNSKSIPFLAKLDATTLETQWEESFVFTQDAFGIACGVGGASKKDDGSTTTNAVYMAGIVENGGTYGTDGTTTSLGQDDIFVVRASTSDGHADWVRQVGTQGNDRLAHGGGSGLLVTTHSDDSIVLFGDTTGDWQATNHKGTEIFVVTMDGATGDVAWTTTETSGTENDGGSVTIQVPKRTDGDAASDGNGNNDGSVGRGDENKEKEKNRPPLMEKTGTGGGIGMIVAIVVLILALIVGYIVRSRKEEQVTERTAVFSYLHAFDLEDVDVRHSATGGWHGTYVGDLAKGKGLTAAGGTGSSTGSDGGGSSRLSHSSIVKDSLFVDYEASTHSRSMMEDDVDFADDEDRNHFRIGSANDEDEDEAEELNSYESDLDEIANLEEQSISLSEAGDDATDATAGNKKKPGWGRDIV